MILGKAAGEIPSRSNDDVGLGDVPGGIPPAGGGAPALAAGRQCARRLTWIDKNGQQIASAGETAEFDSTSLASLTAGNVAPTDGLAKLISEREF